MTTPIRLFCFSHAGSSAAPYARWRRTMPASIEVVPVELPGRGLRRDEPFATNVEQLLADLERGVGTPTRPFAFFGHSLGASAAFAYAQRLRARRAAGPLAVFVSANHAPGTRSRPPRSWSDEDLRDELVRLDGTPAAVLSSPELLALMLPVLRADYQLAADLEQRLTRAPIAAPLHVLAGTRDELEPSALCAWRALTEARFQLSWFTGGHFYLHEHEAALTALIARELGSDPFYGTFARGGAHGHVAEG